MRSLRCFNLTGCQVAHVDRTVMITGEFYTISVDLGLSLYGLNALYFFGQDLNDILIKIYM